MKTVTINTGQLITLATGRFSCTMDEVYSAFNSILEDNIYTHGLVGAGNFVEPRINELFPWVREIVYEYPDTIYNARKAITDWLESVSNRYGSVHEVPVMSDEWTSNDPLEELADIVSKRERKEKN